MAQLQQQQQQQQSPPHSGGLNLEALIQAAQYLEDSESKFSVFCIMIMSGSVLFACKLTCSPKYISSWKQIDGARFVAVRCIFLRMSKSPFSQSDSISTCNVMFAAEGILDCF